MSQVKLIGLHGPAQSGKDTTYEQIKRIYEETTTSVVRDAFADRLKESAARSLGLPYFRDTAVKWADKFKATGSVAVNWDSRDKPPYIITGRQYLQYYGTEAHRDVFGDGFWIEAVIPDPSAPAFGRDDLYDGDVLVITDVRFPNEAEAIRDAGGEVWRISRPEVEKGDGHASEQPLPGELIDRVIDNSGDITNLFDRVYRALYGRNHYDDRELREATPEQIGNIW